MQGRPVVQEIIHWFCTGGNCGLVTPNGDIYWINISSDNGLLPDGTKPLSKPMATSHGWVSAAFTLEQFISQWLSYYSKNDFENYNLKITVKSPRHQWVSIVSGHANKVWDQVLMVYFYILLPDDESLGCTFVDVWLYIRRCYVHGEKRSHSLISNLLKWVAFGF